MGKYRFVLTRDMCPIHYQIRDGFSMAQFIVPVPKGYVDILRKLSLIDIREAVEKIIKDVNEKVQRQEDPFQNLLLGYEDRDAEGQEKLVKQCCVIKYWQFDARGLYTVSMFGAEGDAYLSSEGSMKCDNVVHDLAERYFDNEYAFFCHNMDFYHQALMVREVLVRYFNFLTEAAEKGTQA